MASVMGSDGIGRSTVRFASYKHVHPPPPAVPVISCQHQIPTSTSPRILNRTLAAPDIKNSPDTGALMNKVFITLRDVLQSTRESRPIIVGGITPSFWDSFQKRYTGHPSFKSSRWEYDDVRQKIIVIPLSDPFHDVACKIMTQQIFNNPNGHRLGTFKRLQSIFVDRENFTKQSSTGTGQSRREPDCAVWTNSHQGGVIPTIIWEVGHSQKRSSLFRRAKMWCRRYDGQVRVVILVKYLRKNPRTNNASILEVYRPVRRQSDGRWTAICDGPIYTLFPRPDTAARDVYNNPADSIPLTYTDYWGPANIGVDPVTGEEIEASRRFDLPLELVREVIEMILPVTINREGYRFVSGGSSVLGEVRQGPDEHDEQIEVEQGEQQEGRVSPIGADVVEYQEFEGDWDDAMSDISDDRRID